MQITVEYADGTRERDAQVISNLNWVQGRRGLERIEFDCSINKRWRKIVIEP